MHPDISVIIPNRNGSATIARCLEAVLATITARDEVIVVDDGSADGSPGIIRRYPCTLITLDRHAGASRARNIGAQRARKEALFFVDADCVLQDDTLELVRAALAEAGHSEIIGGTYTAEPVDRDFFSRFQSVFIHYAETRSAPAADYVASHAMAMYRTTFLQSGGFPELFLPLIEDVELSHRLRRSGCRLVMRPDIQVRHIFRFSLARSLRNAHRKARYWTRYSLANKDLFADSGTASRELKTNVLLWTLSLAAAGAAAFAHPALLTIIPVLAGASAVANRSLLAAWHRTGGTAFSLAAAVYYLLVYPAAVAAGGLLGLAEHVALAGQGDPGLRTRKGPST